MDPPESRFLTSGLLACGRGPRWDVSDQAGLCQQISDQCWTLDPSTYSEERYPYSYTIETSALLARIVAMLTPMMGCTDEVRESQVV